MSPGRLCRSALASILCIFLSGGCAGYHIGNIQPKFMEGIHSIAVPAFKNDTLIPRIEVLVSDTFVRQIQQDGTYKIASSEATADAVMEGVITEVRRRASRDVIGDVQATQEFEMTLVVHYRIIRRATGEVVDERNVNGTTTFFVSGDVNQDELQAVPIAAEDAAVRMVAEISEGW